MSERQPPLSGPSHRWCRPTSRAPPLSTTQHTLNCGFPVVGVTVAALAPLLVADDAAAPLSPSFSPFRLSEEDEGARRLTPPPPVGLATGALAVVDLLLDRREVEAGAGSEALALVAEDEEDEEDEEGLGRSLRTVEAAACVCEWSGGERRDGQRSLRCGYSRWTRTTSSPLHSEGAGIFEAFKLPTGRQERRALPGWRDQLAA